MGIGMVPISGKGFDHPFSFGLQIAVAMGATVICTSSSDEKLQFAEKLGAHHLINYKTHPNWDEEALKLVSVFYNPTLLTITNISSLFLRSFTDWRSWSRPHHRSRWGWIPSQVHQCLQTWRFDSWYWVSRPGMLAINISQNMGSLTLYNVQPEDAAKNLALKLLSRGIIYRGILVGTRTQ